MVFLLPVGGIVDHRFGIMTTPGHRGTPVGIVSGMRWAADNQAFTQGFDPDVFFDWLDGMLPYRSTCLFIPPADVVGNARVTIDLFYHWSRFLTGWPLAFIAQDGQEDLDFPGGDWTTLFIGGTTEWKMSQAAVKCIERAQELDRHIHIGRVNWHKRYRFFANLPGSEKFTCDGTRTRFDGTQRTVRAWAQYAEWDRRQLRLPLSNA